MLGSVGLIIFYYVIPQLKIGRGVLGIALLLGFVFVATFRFAFLRTVDAEAMRRRILVLGVGSSAHLILQRMRRRADRRGFTIVGFANLGEAQDRGAGRHGSSISTDRSTRGPSAIRSTRSWSDPTSAAAVLPMEELLRCKQSGIEITELVTFFERESGKVKLTLAEPSWLVYLARVRHDAAAAHDQARFRSR